MLALFAWYSAKRRDVRTFSLTFLTSFTSSTSFISCTSGQFLPAHPLYSIKKLRALPMRTMG